MTPDKETPMPPTEAEAREVVRRADCRRRQHAPDFTVNAAGRLVALCAWCECGAVKWQPEIVDGANL